VLSQRENLSFDAPIVSDTAALHGFDRRDAGQRRRIACAARPDARRLATTLNEIAKQSNVGMLLQESAIPVNPMVDAACEFLGLDPLYVANEGKLVAICAARDAERLLQ